MKQQNEKPQHREQQAIIVTVDVALFTLLDDELSVGLLRRANEPCSNKQALPGGYIRPEQDFDTTTAARRVLLEKTGIRAPYLEQLGTFGSENRDPRGWSISVAHYALVAAKHLLEQSFPDFTFVPVNQLGQLPFDHNRIVEMCLARLRNKSAYSTLPCYLLEKQFTLSELHHTYQSVMGATLDKSAFRRKFNALDVLVEVGERRGGQHRPAALYALKKEVEPRLFERPI